MTRGVNIVVERNTIALVINMAVRDPINRRGRRRARIFRFRRVEPPRGVGPSRNGGDALSKPYDA